MADSKALTRRIAASAMRRGLAGAFLLAAFPAPSPRAQTIGPSAFGKNKVVIKDFDWKVRQTDHFDIYYYDGSATWVDKTSEILERAWREVSSDLGVTFEKRRPFFLYANQDDMIQSTIVPFLGDGVGGVTEPLKDRFMAYADGSENWLEIVERHEYVHINEFRILIDGGFRSARVLRSFVYPLWYMEGLAEYYTGVDDKTMEDMVLRDGATSGRLFSLTRLQHIGHLKPHQVTPAYKEGASALRFLADQYGEQKPAELLKAFKGRFDVSSAIREVTGADLLTFDRKFREYLEDKYALQVEREGLGEPVGRQVTESDRDGIPQFNTSPVIMPDGKSVVYLTTRHGFPPTIDRTDLRSGRTREVVGRPYEWVENIPMGRFSEVARVLSLSPDGRTLVFGGQKNHVERLYLVDLRTGSLSSISMPGLMTVMMPSFSPDGKKIAFSGMKEGRTDIYLYDLKSRKLENLTRTPEDDQSPSFSPDGRWLVYSVERNDPKLSPPHQRDLFLLDLEARTSSRLTRMEGSERDPVFSPDGRRVLFTGDPGDINDLYEIDVENGRIARRTRSIGGSSTGQYLPSGKGIVYAAYRRGSYHLYQAKLEELVDEEVEAPALPVSSAAVAAVPPGVERGPYRFRFGTDLFLPAFFFSSQGGLFWTSFWQGSDFMGRHQLQNFITLSSGQGFLNYNLTYTYTRYRPQIFIGGAGIIADDVFDQEEGRDFDLNLNAQFVGVAYPFDRFHRVELTLTRQSEIRDFVASPDKEFNETRSVTLAFVRDTIGGRYLVATHGTRLRLSLTQGLDVFGGNQQLTTWFAEGQKLVPLGGQTAIALRVLSADSFGPDADNFALGGIGGVRGFRRDLGGLAGSRLLLANAEFRFPIVQNLDYYMWYIFPDLYFKAIFGAIFYDVGAFGDNFNEFGRNSFGGLPQSVGAGVRIHTFVLQRFPFVLSLDYARNLNVNDSRVRFFIGPAF